MSDHPLVSVIIPSTPDRYKYLGRLTDLLLSPGYDKIEILIDLDPGSIGEKRNRLCERAKGEIILHMDSDDMYSTDWVLQCAAGLMAMENTSVDIIGLNNPIFYNEADQLFYQYHYSTNPGNFLCGATLCYRKSFWERNKFSPIQIGEDWEFTHRAGVRVFAHGYVDGFCGTIHEGNTSKKVIDGIRYKLLGEQEQQRLKNIWGPAIDALI